MLFLVAMAGAMMAVSMTGVGFERSLAVSVAALSNTGPLFSAVEPGASWLTSISAEARAILVLVMVLGRVELLALIALLNTDNWR
jgi:trk system potassium uptake protein TrkH